MGATLSAGVLFRALAPELLMSAGAMVMLLATVWNPQSNDAAMAEGAEKTSALTRFGVVLCLLVGLVVMIAWGDGVNGTPDLRIAGDGFRWAVDLVILLGTVLSLILLDAEHHRSAAFSP